MRRRAKIVSSLLPLVALCACEGRIPGSGVELEEPSDAATVLDCAESVPDVAVEVTPEGFFPDELDLAAGQVVRFDNVDFVAHTVSSWDIFDGVPRQETPHFDEPLPAGSAACVRFEQPGEITFLDELYPMTAQGVAVVREALEDVDPSEGEDEDDLDEGGVISPDDLADLRERQGISR